MACLQTLVLSFVTRWTCSRSLISPNLNVSPRKRSIIILYIFHRRVLKVKWDNIYTKLNMMSSPCQEIDKYYYFIINKKWYVIWNKSSGAQTLQVLLYPFPCLLVGRCSHKLVLYNGLEKKWYLSLLGWSIEKPVHNHLLPLPLPW